MRELLSYSTEAIKEEKITLRIRTGNDGYIRIPTAGYNVDGTQGCEYDWYITYDGGEPKRFTGKGTSSSKIDVAFGLKPNTTHSVTIKPVNEDYGWARAFGYKGTSIASSLVNIVSDKSFKGFALSDFYTGDYFKAYQYYGCTNLINTDEEFIPSTVGIVGNYYRAGEYWGCTKLEKTASEHLPKNVRYIGDSYRQEQYKGDTLLKKATIIANDYASAGVSYRLNQFEDAGYILNTKGQFEVYIKGGYVEGGNINFNNNSIKNIYVHNEVIDDYKEAFSSITSTKIVEDIVQANQEYEYIELMIDGDTNGDVYIPCAGYADDGNQDNSYDWFVYVDNEDAINVTGTGAYNKVERVYEGEPGAEHKIIIRPNVLEYGWARAFGCGSNSSVASNIKEIRHDCFMGYAMSFDDTGDNYKREQFMGSGILNTYERLPSSVVTIGDNYMRSQFENCLSLITADCEVVYIGSTIGTNYRYRQFYNCSGLQRHYGIIGVTYASGYRDNQFYGAGDDLELDILRYEPLPSTVLYHRDTLGYGTTQIYTIPSSGTYNITCNVYEGGSQGATDGEVLVGGAVVGSATASNRGQTAKINTTFTASSGTAVSIKVTKYSYGNGNVNDINISRVVNATGLDANNVLAIYCYAGDLPNYEGNTAWSSLYSKFRPLYYSYQIYELKDINRYTKLLATVSVPNPYVRDGLSTLGRGLAIMRDMSEFAVPGLEYDLDSKGNNHVGAIRYTPNWTKVGDDKVLSSLSYKSQEGWAGSSWSGSNISYAGGLAYGPDGYIHGHYAYNGSNYDYAGERKIGSLQTSGDQTVAGAISRDGLYLWGYLGGRKRWKAGSPYGWTSTSESKFGGAFGNLAFSDDGFTMIGGNSSWSALYQYNLTKQWDTESKGSSVHSLSVYGAVCFSYDFRYLFVFNWEAKTLKQYTYV